MHQPIFALRSPPPFAYAGHDAVEANFQKANFGLSGALAKDEETGNVFKGVKLKWREPDDAAMPTRRYRFYVFKDDKNIDTLHLHRQSAFLVGREKKIADIYMRHPSCSMQHAVVQFRTKASKKDPSKRRVVPYLLDLGSTNGTTINGDKVEDARYYELKVNDILKFGSSSREFVLMCMQ